MINFFIQQFFNVLDWIYINLHIVDLINKISDLMTTSQTYITNWNKFVEIVYFVIGKPFTLIIVTTGAVVIIAKLVFALINLIGQYVP